MKHLANILLLVALATAFAALMWLDDHYNRDDSDPQGQHSGMVPRVDAKTGCEYLTGPLGITPRLDRNGKQVCAR